MDGICLLPEALLGGKKATSEVQTRRGPSLSIHSGAAGLLCTWLGRAEFRDSGAKVRLLEEYSAGYQRIGTASFCGLLFYVGQYGSYHLLSVYLLVVLKVALSSLDSCHLAGG